MAQAVEGRPQVLIQGLIRLDLYKEKRQGPVILV